MRAKRLWNTKLKNHIDLILWNKWICQYSVLSLSYFSLLFFFYSCTFLYCVTNELKSNQSTDSIICWPWNHFYSKWMHLVEVSYKATLYRSWHFGGLVPPKVSECNTTVINTNLRSVRNNVATNYKLNLHLEVNIYATNDPTLWPLNAQHVISTARRRMTGAETTLWRNKHPELCQILLYYITICWLEVSSQITFFNFWG